MYYLRRKPKKASEGGKTGRKRGAPDYVAKLDRVFALYIRLRDVMPNGYGKCISCGKIKHFSDLQCGHYFSRKNMSVRFDPTNCHAECAGCNCFSADHLIGYRENLIRKIGQARYDLLVSKAHTSKKYEDFELKELIKYYTNEVRRLSRDKGIDVKI